MQLSIILAALTALAVSASPVAAPVESLSTKSPEVETKVYPDGLPKELVPRTIDESESELEKRQSISGVYLCTDRNFGGYCVHITAPWYRCVNLAGDLNDLVSSVGPDSGYCIFYRDFNCQDNGNPYAHFGTYSPGYSDLTSISFNDQISSYQCSP